MVNSCSLWLTCAQFAQTPAIWDWSIKIWGCPGTSLSPGSPLTLGIIARTRRDEPRHAEWVRRPTHWTCAASEVTMGGR